MNGCQGYSYQSFGNYGPIYPSMAGPGYDYYGGPRNDYLGYDYSESERYF